MRCDIKINRAAENIPTRNKRAPREKNNSAQSGEGIFHIFAKLLENPGVL